MTVHNLFLFSLSFIDDSDRSRFGHYNNSFLQFSVDLIFYIFLFFNLIPVHDPNVDRVRLFIVTDRAIFLARYEGVKGVHVLRFMGSQEILVSIHADIFAVFGYEQHGMSHCFSFLVQMETVSQ